MGLPQLKDVCRILCRLFDVFQPCIDALERLWGQFRPRLTEVFLQKTQVGLDLCPGIIDLLVCALYTLVDVVACCENTDGALCRS